MYFRIYHKKSECISEKMKGDERKIYECLEFSFELPEEQRKVMGSRECHMISYFPSGEIQIKKEISS